MCTFLKLLTYTAGSVQEDVQGKVEKCHEQGVKEGCKHGLRVFKWGSGDLHTIMTSSKWLEEGNGAIAKKDSMIYYKIYISAKCVTLAHYNHKKVLCTVVFLLNTSKVLLATFL